MESDLTPDPRDDKARRSRAPQSRDADRKRKQRLLQMIDLAQSYLGCSKSQAAILLNRDPAKVAPDSGNPKLDLVVGLSEMLDWSVGDVAEALWRDPVEDEFDQEPPPENSFDELNREAVAAYREGDHKRMRRLGEFMWRMAKTPVERAKAANRIASSYDQAGRYAKALEWARVAASESGVPPEAHINYLANLANLNYAAWNLHEAAALAAEVLALSKQLGGDDWRVVNARAFAGYVAGNARRRMMAMLPEYAARHGSQAVEALQMASAVYNELKARPGGESLGAMVNLCEGALVEVRTLLGETSPHEATQQLLNGLEAVTDPSVYPRGEWLESWGWWAVFGLNIVIRSMEGEERERLAAIFSTKAHQIADRLENWAIRERVFSLEHDLKMSPDSGTTDASKKRWVLDREDVRVLLGTMGRFPWFRKIGWQILQNAEFI